MSGARILVLDDDQGMGETIRDVLERQGYVVQIATRAQDGLDIVAASPIEAAIVDIQLPDMSGLDVLHGIRKARPTTEIIFITGHASLATAIKAINGLAFAYLVKPFDMSHLLTTVEQAVQKQRLAQALLDSEERYRFVTENIADAVFLLELDGRIAMGNHRAEIDHRLRAGGARRPVHVLAATGGGSPGSAGPPERGARGRGRVAVLRGRAIRKDGARVLIEVHVTSVLKDGPRSPGWAWPATSPSAAAWRSSSARPRRWRRSAGSPAAWPTTSTTCSPSSSATASSCSDALDARTTRSGGDDRDHPGRRRARGRAHPPAARLQPQAGAASRRCST